MVGDHGWMTTPDGTIGVVKPGPPTIDAILKHLPMEIHPSKQHGVEDKSQVLMVLFWNCIWCNLSIGNLKWCLWRNWNKQNLLFEMSFVLKRAENYDHLHHVFFGISKHWYSNCCRPNQAAQLRFGDVFTTIWQSGSANQSSRGSLSSEKCGAHRHLELNKC